MNIDEIRANANPVESGDLDSFIETWKWPLFVEPKADGERAWIMKSSDAEIQAFNKHKTIYSADTHKDLFNNFKDFGNSFIIEGEMKLIEGGLYSYLKARMSGEKVQLYCFDILEYNGVDLRQRPLSERKKFLRNPDILPYAEFNSKKEILSEVEK